MTEQVANYDELDMLPITVVVRTKNGVVRERDRHGWYQMGSEHSVMWTAHDFPVEVIWTPPDTKCSCEYAHEPDVGAHYLVAENPDCIIHGPMCF